MHAVQVRMLRGGDSVFGKFSNAISSILVTHSKFDIELQGVEDS